MIFDQETILNLSIITFLKKLVLWKQIALEIIICGEHRGLKWISLKSIQGGKIWFLINCESFVIVSILCP